VHDLFAIVESVAGELEAYARERDVRLHVERRCEATPARYYAVRVAQVLHNLISNATKFTTPPSEVSIALDLGALNLMEANVQEAMRSAVQITVSGCGIGIPEPELALVFDKFTQSSKTNTGAGGLGLAISHAIVVQHGGCIWAANNAAGGADFIVLLPREFAGTVSKEMRAERAA
jgi:signal transduction histidine kinase